MSYRKFLIAGLVLLSFHVAFAQQTVYKWVDEHGVVHFSDGPPPGTSGDDAETVTLDSPTVIPSEAVTNPRGVPRAAGSSSGRVPSADDLPVVVAKPDITEMSLAELDQRCDVAREKKIAPLREAEIEKCKQDKRTDPEWCERFNASYGEGGRTVSGTIRPRMFDDLPECVEAQQERNRRPR